MEGNLRSGDVVKKKKPSGCLIIKKKGDAGLEKKRPRYAVSDSDSSGDSLGPVGKNRGNEFRDRPGVNRSSAVGGSKFGRSNETESEPKRKRLDLFEFDEYDEFDEDKLRNDHGGDMSKVIGGSGSSREFGSGLSRNAMIQKRKNAYFGSSSGPLNGNSMIEKRKQAYFGSSGGLSKGKNKEVVYRSKKRRNLDEDDGDDEDDDDDDDGSSEDDSDNSNGDEEEDVPISVLRLKQQKVAEKPIRLQGKNGVLKVRMDGKTTNYEGESRKVSGSKDITRKVVSVQTSNYLNSERPKKRVPLIEEKDELKLRKSLVGKGSKSGYVEKDGTDTSLKQKSPALQVGRMKRVKREHERSSPTKDKTPAKGRQEIVKRGGSTEKQLLRERIKEMLIKAGWKIDYRPRRNRDYLDSVYISPSGTGYWSIVKAYDAFQKQFDEEGDENKTDGASPSFASLSEEINKLTRQTQKKIEREMRRKNKEDRLRNRKTSVRKHDDVSTNGIQGRKSREIGRCTLLVRSSDKGQKSEADGYVPYMGKRTLLAWMIDSGTVKLSEKVQYMNRKKTQAKLEGWITRDGIHCGCCSKIVSVSKFELHAGSKLRQPFQNITLESGVSLLQCLVDAWNKQEVSERQDFYFVDVDGDDPDDDTCGICGDGGDLICCDGCPSTFHQSCLEIQMLPEGEWHCPNCACKFCGTASWHAEDDDKTDGDEIVSCGLCERKFHESCSQLDNLSSDSNKISTSFCGKRCQELHDHLMKIIGVKTELESGLSWSLIQRTDLDSEKMGLPFGQRVECNSKLAIALSVMNECFLPIVDRRSGFNLIHNILYNCGSNFTRLNYRGFYTAILERGDEIISAASIRILGSQLAEMPFIGTRHIYRRQGMCRHLLSAIESCLSSLKVEKLVIPAIVEHMHTWTGVFGFKQIDESQKQEMKGLNMLVFPGIDMLQKPLLRHDTPEGRKVGTGSRGIDDKYKDESVSGHDSDKISRKVNNMNSVSPDSDVPSNDDEDASALDASLGSDTKLNSNKTTSLAASFKPDLQLPSKETIPVESKVVKEEEDTQKPLTNDTTMSYKEDSSTEADQEKVNSPRLERTTSVKSEPVNKAGEMEKPEVDSFAKDAITSSEETFSIDAHQKVTSPLLESTASIESEPAEKAEEKMEKPKVDSFARDAITSSEETLSTDAHQEKVTSPRLESITSIESEPADKAEEMESPKVDSFAKDAVMSSKEASSTDAHQEVNSPRLECTASMESEPVNRTEKIPKVDSFAKDMIMTSKEALCTDTRLEKVDSPPLESIGSEPANKADETENPKADSFAKDTIVSSKEALSTDVHLEEVTSPPLESTASMESEPANMAEEIENPKVDSFAEDTAMSFEEPLSTNVDQDKLNSPRCTVDSADEVSGRCIESEGQTPLSAACSDEAACNDNTESNHGTTVHAKNKVHSTSNVSSVAEVAPIRDAHSSLVAAYHTTSDVETEDVHVKSIPNSLSESSGQACASTQCIEVKPELNQPSVADAASTLISEVAPLVALDVSSGIDNPSKRRSEEALDPIEVGNKAAYTEQSTDPSSQASAQCITEAKQENPTVSSADQSVDPSSEASAQGTTVAKHENPMVSSADQCVDPSSEASPQATTEAKGENPTISSAEQSLDPSSEASAHKTAEANGETATDSSGVADKS